jgi:SAM-dependent methyltransferase
VTRLHDVLLETLPASAFGRVLDAGCGMGGTMLDLAARTPAVCTGLTLSMRQALIGTRAIERAGLAARVAILVRSYDDPPQGPYDSALAIESLAHSPHPAASLRAIAARLAPGAWLAIVDDLPDPAARGTRDLTLFETGWQAPAPLTRGELAAELQQLGLDIVADRDLTAELRPRSLERIAVLERLNRLLRRLAPTARLRTLLDSYHGGLALERLYRHGLMSYRLIVARKGAA